MTASHLPLNLHYNLVNRFAVLVGKQVKKLFRQDQTLFSFPYFIHTELISSPPKMFCARSHYTAVYSQWKTLDELFKTEAGG